MINQNKTVTILGATGSIGQNTIDIIRRNKDKFDIKALTAHQNIEALAGLAIEFQPEYIAIGDESKLSDLKQIINGRCDCEIAAGIDAIEAAGQIETDFVMSAIVGVAGLKPTMAAIKRGATIALANKETLVAAGDLVLEACKKSGAILLPTDSEHNAIYQVFENKNRDQILKLHLTGSGGPFRTWSKADMAKVTPAQAIKHPNWSMGAKISVDSASMMNKGLELIEACYLFDLPEDKIDIVIHPQSVIHSMVEYKDGSVLAQLGSPDMRTPIAYCLGWPERMDTGLKPLDFFEIAKLEFEKPDYDKFPSLTMARHVAKAGKGYPTIFNAANEVVVDAFLKHKIGFLDIFTIVDKILNAKLHAHLSSIDDVMLLDQKVRQETKKLILNK